MKHISYNVLIVVMVKFHITFTSLKLHVNNNACLVLSLNKIIYGTKPLGIDQMKFPTDGFTNVEVHLESFELDFPFIFLSLVLNTLSCKSHCLYILVFG